MPRDRSPSALPSARRAGEEPLVPRDRSPSALPSGRRAHALAPAPPEPVRGRGREPGPAELDALSAELGELLVHADELLEEWRRFGGEVQREVRASSAAVGDELRRALSASLDDAARGAASSASSAVELAVRRVLEERVGSQLQGLGRELGKLEARARAAAHREATERRRERVVLAVALLALLACNALLAAAVWTMRGARETPTAAAPATTPSAAETLAPPETAPSAADAGAIAPTVAPEMTDGGAPASAPSELVPRPPRDAPDAPDGAGRSSPTSPAARGTSTGSGAPADGAGAPPPISPAARSTSTGGGAPADGAATNRRARPKRR